MGLKLPDPESESIGGPTPRLERHDCAHQSMPGEKPTGPLTPEPLSMALAQWAAAK